MEQINLKLKRTKIKVEFEDKEYLLTRPTFGEVKQFESERKKVSDGEAEVTDLIFKFLEKCGMPIEISQSLEVEMISQIIDALSGVKKN
mgnify:CR=1 FL=1